jgi:predicted XRE-type DNA-binding protein
MEAYFTVESISRKSDVNFHTLRTRLVAAVKARMHNGEFTERGLAKVLGVSQPHMHNVLKGARTLQWDLADRLIADLGINLLELCNDGKLAGEERVPHLLTESSLASSGAPGDPRPEFVPRKRPGKELPVLQAQRANRWAAL